MGQGLWRLPLRQQQQIQEELADRLADQGGGGQEQGNPNFFQALKTLLAQDFLSLGGAAATRHGGHQCFF